MSDELSEELKAKALKFISKDISNSVIDDSVKPDSNAGKGLVNLESRTASNAGGIKQDDGIDKERMAFIVKSVTNVPIFNIQDPGIMDLSKNDNVETPMYASIHYGIPAGTIGMTVDIDDLNDMSKLCKFYEISPDDGSDYGTTREGQQIKVEMRGVNYGVYVSPVAPSSYEGPRGESGKKGGPKKYFNGPLPEGIISEESARKATGAGGNSPEYDQDDAGRVKFDADELPVLKQIHRNESNALAVVRYFFKLGKDKYSVQAMANILGMMQGECNFKLMAEGCPRKGKKPSLAPYGGRAKGSRGTQMTAAAMRGDCKTFFDIAYNGPHNSERYKKAVKDGARGGYKYRGRGFNQLTGVEAYVSMTAKLKKRGFKYKGKPVNLFTNPELLVTSLEVAVATAFEYYEVWRVYPGTKRVNGKRIWLKAGKHPPIFDYEDFVDVYRVTWGGNPYYHSHEPTRILHSKSLAKRKAAAERWYHKVEREAIRAGIIPAPSQSTIPEEATPSTPPETEQVQSTVPATEPISSEDPAVTSQPEVPTESSTYSGGES